MAAFSQGAFFGAPGAGAGMVGGTAAKALGLGAKGVIARIFSGGLMMLGTRGMDVVTGARDMRKIGVDMAIGYFAGSGGDELESLSTR